MGFIVFVSRICATLPVLKCKIEIHDCQLSVYQLYYIDIISCALGLNLAVHHRRLHRLRRVPECCVLHEHLVL